MSDVRGDLLDPSALEADIEDLSESSTAGEVIEVFVRSTHMRVVSAVGAETRERRDARQARVHVRSYADGSSGTASTDLTTRAGLRQVLDEARAARRTAPVRDVPPVPPPAGGRWKAPFVEPVSARLEDLALELGAETSTRGTVAVTSRCVIRAVTSAGSARYRTVEHQAHVAVTGGEGVGAQAAAVTSLCEELDVGAILGQLESTRGRRAAAPTGFREPAGVVLTPAATARLLSWIVPLLGDLERAGTEVRLGGQHLELVDEQGDMHPNGHPFDDYGMPGRDVVLVRAGALISALRASTDPSRSTSSAVRVDDVQAAPAYARLTATLSQVEPPQGLVFVVDEVSVLQGVATGGSEPSHLMLRGAMLCDDAIVGSVRASWMATVVDVLSAIDAVGADAAAFRYRGLYGGATALLRPLPGTLTDWSTNAS